MKVHDTNRGPLLENNNNSRSITVCEAVNCYEAATETIIVDVGIFGTINLNLCHMCAATKFQITRSQETILKNTRYAGQEIPSNQPIEDYS